jgi:hypothetical protein
MDSPVLDQPGDRLTGLVDADHNAARILRRQADPLESGGLAVADGRGGANRNGSGLRGLADRVEALGGRLSVGDRARGHCTDGSDPLKETS